MPVASSARATASWSLVGPPAEPALVRVAAAGDQVGDGDAVGRDGRLRQQPEHLGDVERAQVGQRRAVEVARRPARGLSSRARPRSSVDLPQALAPTIAVTLPSRSVDVEVARRRPGRRSRGSGPRRAVGVIRRAPCRFVVASSHSRYGAPTAPVTTPVGSGVGSSVDGDEVGGEQQRRADQRGGDDAAGGRAEQPVGDRPGDQRDEDDRPGHGDRQARPARPRWPAARRGCSSVRAPSPRAASSPSSRTRSCRCSSTASGSRTGSGRRAGSAARRAGLADRAGQPVHRLPGLEQLGPAEHVADRGPRRRRRRRCRSG